MNPPGAIVLRDEAAQPPTGGWRTAGRPEADRSRCIDCLLCWIFCPDSAIVLRGTRFADFDYEHCKGCEICVEMCPTDAIRMVAE